MFCTTKVLRELRWTECRTTCVLKTVASFFLTELIYTRLLEKYNKHKKAEPGIDSEITMPATESPTLFPAEIKIIMYTHTQPHTTFSMTENDNMLTGYLLRLYTQSDGYFGT